MPVVPSETVSLEPDARLEMSYFSDISDSAMDVDVTIQLAVLVGEPVEEFLGADDIGARPGL